MSIEEYRNSNRIEQLYHKGQKNIWDGKEYLQECIEKNNGISLPPEKKKALGNIFSTILWGELAAWKISSILAARFEDEPARMAATSQAHDEARHFYVMRDYLHLLGIETADVQGMKSHSQDFLQSIMEADTTPKMILGMQMMVEPMALTLFKVVRERNIEPVLSDLLLMYEKDEARHVALGTLYLPKMMSEMGPIAKADLLVWQFFRYMKQFEMLKELKDDFRALDIPPREVFLLARKKQAKTMELLSEEMGERYPLMDTMLKFIDFRNEIDFPEEESRYLDRLRAAARKTYLKQPSK